ncbi:MAG: V-type ATP synthase subunit D [Acetomicrobium sp.]|uniref:V-type ATP synthase subunit D n=1 Tax=Acetomicrobium TaxID=49894 RepID=UPI0016931BA2|nr:MULTISPECIES: V-type ATP synthase subunit D [Acetomicrobium]MDI9377016.1 V-type ATP synthase subunit D [Synergistota bacterium]NLI43134.1 V-type ATP synthase subunit D [Synergistaceae bacterium]MBP8675186.1 V-type ATP synthase subunit D [Acetomicrobium sp.]MDR9770852.1 V-type ATP synthase subunit D [Acetomicrobium sp.]HOB10999.1 V-type ATP synthase subunit D [Acetomicrobium sp.]
MANKLNVNPNRMMLNVIKKRLVTAKRGHKLLKDKQDALIKEFLQKAREVMKLREKVEPALTTCYRSFLMARAQMVPAILEQSLLMASGGEAMVDVKKRNLMSVVVPEFAVEETGGQVIGYGFAMTSGSLDLALEQFAALLPDLVRLASEEKALRLMACEIERTRRRVNALEYVLIPAFEETIRDITMKLDEMERSNLSRLMRIKEIVRSH